MVGMSIDEVVAESIREERIELPEGVAPAPLPTGVVDPKVKEILGERRLIEPPTRRRSRWGGHLVIVSDGSTVPLLTLLAVHKFGPFDETMKPYWKDANPFNMRMDNVELMVMKAPKKKAYTPQHIVNAEEKVIAGTPEYWRRYRLKNREKFNKYQRERARKAREALREKESGKGKTSELLLEEIILAATKKE